ncbi:MAG TPA: GNAT family N-acetyltransferase [Burkholderiaceae bacterium]|nr:GNAT family N-acetyltransferase [Burkholderiaceae bacterium]
MMTQIALQPVDSPPQRDAARELVTEYLRWVAGVAARDHGLSFDVDAMVRSDIEDPVKFYPPRGRSYLACQGLEPVGVGALRSLTRDIGEIQRMYVRPRARGLGVGRLLAQRLLLDARQIGFQRLRLESLKTLTAAHALYRSLGFVDIAPYDDNSMRDYQAAEALEAYRRSAVFMELDLRRGA